MRALLFSLLLSGPLGAEEKSAGCPAGQYALIAWPPLPRKSYVPWDSVKPRSQGGCRPCPEDEVDWNAVLSRTVPNSLPVPDCGAGQGLAWDEREKAYRCERCGGPERVLKRFSLPVCGNPTRLRCRAGESLVLDRLQQPVACAKVPAP